MLRIVDMIVDGGSGGWGNHDEHQSWLVNIQECSKTRHMLTVRRSGHFSTSNDFHVKPLLIDFYLRHSPVIDCMINKESVEGTSSSDLIASIR